MTCNGRDVNENSRKRIEVTINYKGNRWCKTKMSRCAGVLGQLEVPGSMAVSNTSTLSKGVNNNMNLNSALTLQIGRKTPVALKRIESIDASSQCRLCDYELEDTALDALFGRTMV